MDELIDRGSYYEIRDYSPIIECDQNGEIMSIIYCPYIPEFLTRCVGNSIGRVTDLYKSREDISQ